MSAQISRTPPSSQCLQVFEDIYDASARIRPKHLMPRLGLSSLMIGDVVAVECLCFRTYSQRGQDVAFELQSLLLVGQIPRVIEL